MVVVFIPEGKNVLLLNAVPLMVIVKAVVQVHALPKKVVK